VADDDAIASSTGSWKSIALPQPANIVSLPEIAELPSKEEVVAADKAARKAAKRPMPRPRRSHRSSLAKRSRCPSQHRKVRARSSRSWVPWLRGLLPA